MKLWKAAATGVSLIAGGAAALGYANYRSAAFKAEKEFAKTLSAPEQPAGTYDPAMVKALPEIAQRYFNHAIAPGTPLFSRVELEMSGAFLLGDKAKHQKYQMAARQALRPPHRFVWIPELRSGVMSIVGSDALTNDGAWTRFWLFGIAPVAESTSSPDLVRSARFRAAVEGALWVPTSLLSREGIIWEQLAENTARVTLANTEHPIVLTLTLSDNGAVKQVVGQRWSDANSAKIFRLQPFGGTVSNERTFQGLTVPTEVAVGNHYGTEDYLPFFQAKVTSARFM